MEAKKILAPTIVAIVTLVVLTVGATYAYFMVGTTNNFSTRTAQATTPSVGTVTLAAGSNLYLNLSRVNMMSANQGTYYAVTSSEGTASSTAQTATIATASVTGEGTFTCNYTLNAVYDGDLKEALTVAGTAVLVVNGTDYDVYSTTFPKTISGTMTGLTSSASKTITAQLKFVNTNTNQDALKGKTMTVSFAIASFNCVATA